jgi:hypothetical protein
MRRSSEFMPTRNFSLAADTSSPGRAARPMRVVSFHAHGSASGALAVTFDCLRPRSPVIVVSSHSRRRQTGVAIAEFSEQRDRCGTIGSSKPRVNRFTLGRDAVKRSNR